MAQLRLAIFSAFFLLVCGCGSDAVAPPSTQTDTSAQDTAGNDAAAADTSADTGTGADTATGADTGADAVNPADGLAQDVSATAACTTDLACVQALGKKDLCTKVYCDADTKTCKTAPHPDGTPCDDGSLCTGGDKCAAGACKAGDANLCPKPESDCANKKDDDGDGWVDCDDSDCAKDTVACVTSTENDCKDKADNDKDGKTDCADSDCATGPGCSTCLHDLCVSGPAEKSGCSDCVTKICAADNYCCATVWDNICVGEVSSICKLGCGKETNCTDKVDNDADGKADCADPDCAGSCPVPACAHDACVMGPQLAKGCSPCVTSVCAIDQYCCAVGWDAACVTLASAACATKCPIELGCEDEQDNDGDGKADCADPDCLANAACQPGATETVCDNSQDDDKDGKTDCEDSNCKGSLACPSKVELACGDKVDDDKDGKTDCDDSDCGQSAACTTCAHPLCIAGSKLDKACSPCVEKICAADPFCCASNWDGPCMNAVGSLCGTPCGDTGGKETACGNSVDDDKDGKTDCEDFDCFGNLACVKAPHEAKCANLLDEDGDGKTDCADSDCTGQPLCAVCSHDVCEAGPPLAAGCDVCVTKVCAANPGCCSSAWGPECATAAASACGKKCDEKGNLCADLVDNDGDGKTDCGDDGCKAASACAPKTETGCGDKVDEDLDSKTDCDDLDCEGATVCPAAKTEANCTDKKDGDKDGKTDCDDSDCKTLPMCIPGPGCPHDKCVVGPSLPATCDPCVGQICAAMPGCCNSPAPDAWGPACVQAVSTTCGASCSSAEAICNDKLDDDKDGKTDCDDSDCYFGSKCVGIPGELDCGNKADDDKDGKTDCADSDCGGSAACAAAGACKPGAALTCDAVVKGNNGATLSTNVTEAWTCKDGTATDGDTGPEFGYSYLAACNGAVMFTVKKTGTAVGFLDLIVLDGTLACGPQTKCLSSAAMTGSEVSVTVPITKGQLIQVLVEGYNKLVSNFDLTATCTCK